MNGIAPNQARGFCIQYGSGEIPLFLVRRDDQWYVYLNRCPHTGVNLDWQPNRFLDETGTLIQCATHGALFRIQDGYCIAGPCRGASLTPVAITWHGDQIYLQLQNTD
jgi:nitrite reductase/ring-hydroxylating ferredoxin subunit